MSFVQLQSALNNECCNVRITVKSLVVFMSFCLYKVTIYCKQKRLTKPCAALIFCLNLINNIMKNTARSSVLRDNKYSYFFISL